MPDRVRLEMIDTVVTSSGTPCHHVCDGRPTMFTDPTLWLGSRPSGTCQGRAVVNRLVRWPLSCVSEVVGTHHLWITVWMSEHENICQLIHFAICKSQRRRHVRICGSLGIMIVDEHHSVFAGQSSL